MLLKVKLFVLKKTTLYFIFWEFTPNHQNANLLPVFSHLSLFFIFYFFQVSKPGEGAVAFPFLKGTHSSPLDPSAHTMEEMRGML